MTDNLHSSNRKIVSLSDANQPIGVNPTKIDKQFVFINAPVQDWKLHKVDDDKYHLSIGGYPYTGVLDGKVIASIHAEHQVEWEIVHQEHQHGYIIALGKDPQLGWTVPLHSTGFHEIEIGPIISTFSIPPQFLPTQLFSFKQSD